MVAPKLLRLAALALAASFACCVGAVAAEDGYPPAPRHYVTDGAGALGEPMRQAIEATLRSYERSTGHQVIVWIAESTGGVPLETWTATAAHTWKIGRKGKDDGAVLFLFMRDHRVRIEVGYGLESKLTDATAKQIIDDEIVPRMKGGDVDDAVGAGVNDMLEAISGAAAPAVPLEAAPPPPPGEGAPSSSTTPRLGLILFILLFAIPWVFAIAMIVHRARHGFTIAGGWGDSTPDDDDSSSSSGDDDFSAGGGDFGGGGASGSW